MNEPTVAVLGAGALGAAMAARLGDTGHQVNLRNCTPARARAIAGPSTGVTAVADLRDAVKHAPVVLTIPRDAAAVAQVMNDAIGDLDARAVWVQASTVGPNGARSLGELASSHAIAYLDAPVSGSTGPARNGTLVWLASGSREAFERGEPTLRHLGSAVEYLGSGVGGSAVKVAVNAWMTATPVAMSDVLTLCDALGIDHELFARVVVDGPLATPYAQQKATPMDTHSYAAGFAVELARKDLGLAEQTLPLSPLLLAVRQRLDQVIADGYGHDDLAAVDYRRGDPD